MRKLSNYNFGVQDSSLDSSTMHIWNETIAQRGANEICSCIYEYIHSNYTPLERGQIGELILWTDRCVGQNNNIFVVRLKHGDSESSSTNA